MSPGTTIDPQDPRRYEHLSRLRLERPGEVAAAAARRVRHPGPVLGEQNLIIAADHPARGALAVGPDPFAMADRRDLLDRLRTALENPAVDGVLASPDVL
ncbi:MAG: deoxyribose-phosphate aldolase, partial [Arthrobacter sp.]